jgi:hypothetical protein
VFNWFIEDPATTTVSTYYSALAGEGWRRAEGSPNAEISINVGTKKYTSVKLVATQGNSKYVATAKIYNKASTNSACINITDTIPPVLTCVTDLSGVDYVWTITDDGGYTSGLEASGNEYTITNYAQYTAPHTFKCGVYKNGELVAIGERRYSNGETVISDFILKLENGSQAFIYNEAGELLSTEQPLTTALYSAAGERISSNLFEVEWSIPNAFESTISSDVCIFNIPRQYNYSLSGNNITAAVRYQGHLISATTSFSFTKNGMMGTNGTNYVCKIRKIGAAQFYDFEQLKSGDSIKFEAFAYSVNNPSASVEIKDVKCEIITKVKNPKVKLSGSTVTFASGQTLTAEDIYILSASFKITGDAA